MLRLKTISYLRPISPLRPLFPSTASPRRVSLAPSRRPLSVAAAMAPTVEHLVLFQVKPDTDPSLADAMLTNLRSLVTLDGVSHIAAAPILRHRSAAAEAFTHLLHSRYPSKPDLAAYSDHPSHRGVVKDYVLPICSDIMAVDWEAGIDSGPLVVGPGSAVRVTLAKLREGAGEEEKAQVLEAIGGIKAAVPPGVNIEQVSFGVNFSPARAKGYSVAVLAVFPGVEELDKLDSMGEIMEEQKKKVKSLLEGVIVLDFVVPPSQSACL